MSVTDAVYSFPNEGLVSLNPWLKNDASYNTLVATGCSEKRDRGSVCHDKPGIGSGFTQLSRNYFLGMTDRGPAQDCQILYNTDSEKYKYAEGKVGRGFPVDKFAPTITHFSHDHNSRAIVPRRFVPLVGNDGQSISGLPNTEADDTPYPADCKGMPLSYDPSGLDTEDLARIPETDFVAIVDEYAPSVVIANFKTGSIIARHVPSSLMKSLSEARYKIIADIPDVFSHRRKNRGFESVVVDAKGKYVIAIMQSPMLGNEKKETVSNTIIRCVYFQLKVTKEGMPQLFYAKSFIIEASSPTAYLSSDIAPKDLKYSAAQYHSTGKFIALERAKGQVKLFLIDFSKATNLENTRYSNDLSLERETNGKHLPIKFGVIAAEKTRIWDSAPGTGGSINFQGSSKMEGFAVDMDDDSKVWMVHDNEFGLSRKGCTQMSQISLGRAPSGSTVCQKPNHPPSPQVDVKPTRKIAFANAQTYRRSNEPEVGAARDLDVDEMANRTYVVNKDTGAIDMYDVSTRPVTLMDSLISEKPYVPTSISVCKDIPFVAVGMENQEDQEEPGRVDIISKDLSLLRKVKHSQCIGVSDVKWSDDCKYIVAACEGVGIDVPGSVLVIDFAGSSEMRFRHAKVANFLGFDEVLSIVTENGVRLIESHKPSMDLEPKRIAIDGKHAFITLQENNAIAVVDIDEGKVTELKPIGYIERNRHGFGLDASDKDGKINIRTYDFLYGMPQPDGIQKYVANDGKTYLVLANEGAAKEAVEEARGMDITDKNKLNRTAVAGLKQLVEDEKALGRLKFSTIMGYNKSTNTQEKMFHFGGRSFSIMSLDGMIVFDSGEWFARILERKFPKIFNSNGFDSDDMSLSQKDLFDTRSDDNGMEPESLSLMQKDGKTYAFIGLERASVIAVFDITNPTSPTFVDALHNHPKSGAAGMLFENGRQGDIDLEGLFASVMLNKLFAVGYASNTVTSYDIEM